MICKRAITAAAAAAVFAGSAVGAMAQASDAVKSAPTRSKPGASEGMLPAGAAKPRNEPGSSEGMTAPGSKSNAEAETKQKSGDSSASPTGK